MTDLHIHYMRHALNLARRNIGFTAENPSVGCVIVLGGRIVGRGVTAHGGRPHAETEALVQAGEQARGADVYVTLEPCAHQGQTPPCAQALIDAGVARVFVACGDPDPRVNGRGVQMLRDAEIDVTENMLEHEANAADAGFMMRVMHSRPFVTLKTGTSWDAKVALGNGKSQWITSKLSRAHVHLMRARHDAILLGINAAIDDDPMLTTRVNGVNHKSIRIVLDSRLKLPLSSALVRSARDVPLWIVYQSGDPKLFEDAGVRVIKTEDQALVPLLNILAAEGISRLFVEGGAKIYQKFMQENIWDEMLWYRAPKFMGGDAQSAIVDAIAPMNLTDMSAVPAVKRKKSIVLGQDCLDILVKDA
jgi:diaminohydroxyphosphoribosylaminopyrimidine deaminase/5-amino-6-(5-phosphoribosylamino)uracil reductase